MSRLQGTGPLRMLSRSKGKSEKTAHAKNVNTFDADSMYLYFSMKLISKIFDGVLGTRLGILNSG